MISTDSVQNQTVYHLKVSAIRDTTRCRQQREWRAPESERLRCPEAGLLHHSDRGGQHTSADYQRLLAAHGITVSMSRTGNCYDNAALESFFAPLKTECVAHRFPTRQTAHAAIFDYIEVWHNRRRHSSLGYLSPATFETHQERDKITVY